MDINKDKPPSVKSIGESVEILSPPLPRNITMLDVIKKIWFWLDLADKNIN